ncbi:MAG: fumarylacetoacetate hydrolase family protein [Chromatiales bacterium]|nr:fumarylacetoacetate hydrolase family protein [Chromatiales bacterium]
MNELRLLDGSTIAARNLFCIGRNYAEHAAELHNPVPTEPVVFLKPSSALLSSGGQIRLPVWSRDVQHEVELVVLLGEGGRDISNDQALAKVAGYGVGIDVTARDIQTRAKQNGLPWTLAKGLDTFAPLSEFIPAGRIADPQALQLSLEINGQPRQRGNTADMLFPVAELIVWLSARFSLARGDLLFTGSPAGVGPIVPGDRLTARLQDYSPSGRNNSSRSAWLSVDAIAPPPSL